MDAAALLAFREQCQMGLEAMFPAMVRFPGQATEVVCAGGGTMVTGAQLQAGGWVLEYEVAFRVRRELVTRAPVAGEQLTYAGRKYVVGRVGSPVSDVAYVVGANEE